MSRVTGKPITRLQHIRQSIEDILTTSNFERIYRNDYGANLKRLIDEPLNESLLAGARVIITRAVTKFETRVVVNQVDIRVFTNGEGFDIKLYIIDRLTQTKEVIDVSIGVIFDNG
jgi:phage baseplate assembly protein W